MTLPPTPPQPPPTAVVIIASTRAAGGGYPDRTGPVIVKWLTARGFAVRGPVVRADGPDVAEALRIAVGAGQFRPDPVGAELVITSGGTGISPTDRTPQATAELLDYEIPGLAAAIRAEGADKVPTAVLSRGVAGVSGRTAGCAMDWPSWDASWTMHLINCAAGTTSQVEVRRWWDE